MEIIYLPYTQSEMVLVELLDLLNQFSNLLGRIALANVLQLLAILDYFDTIAYSKQYKVTCSQASTSIHVLN